MIKMIKKDSGDDKKKNERIEITIITESGSIYCNV